MQTEVPWLHVPWTRIYYYGGTSGVSAVMESFGTQVTLHQLQEDYLLERAGFCGDAGNGEWRRYCRTWFQDAAPAAGSQLMTASCGDNAAMETAMELGKM